MTSLQQIDRQTQPDVLRPRGASHEVLFATPAAVFRRFQELFQVRQIHVPNSFEIDVKSTVDSRVIQFFFHGLFLCGLFLFWRNLRFVAVDSLYSLSPASCSVAICPSIPHTVRLSGERFVSEAS